MAICHTPGPWSVTTKHSGQSVVGPDGGVLADCWSSGPDPDARIQQNQANARLIAAAPDMLAMLKQCVEPIHLHCYGVLGERLMQVIAKAEGRS